MNLNGAVAVVTGASSGIGRAAALELARRGASLALAARRVPGLDSVAAECRGLGARCEIVKIDVSDRDSCHALIESATRLLGQVDVLVNNAGFGTFDRWADARPEDLQAMLATNYLGAVWCTQAVLPQMLARRGGAIVNVASIAGLIGFATMGGYCATKFALIGFTESLRSEVAGHGITVSAICPSTTDTEFFDHAEREKMPGASRLAFAMKPERIARAICDAAESGSYRKIMPFVAALLVRVKEMFPRTAHFLVQRVSRAFEKEPV